MAIPDYWSNLRVRHQGTSL